MRPVVVALLVVSGPGCASNAAPADGGLGADAPPVVDLCDAFTGVDTPCPFASPVRCFPACEASGCYCSRGAAGPRWTCVTDLSCVPDCGPLEDGCGGH